MSKRTVYAVVLDDYDIYNIEGIFETLEEAKKCKAYLNKTNKMWKSIREIDDFVIQDKFNGKDWGK